MASNTPNLDLLKKDPVTDGNDTFNIETMLNENWDKIDAAVGQLEEDMQEIDIPLSDETNGTRSNVAGSEKAVGLVMQAANAANLAAGAAQTKADQAFTAGNERKAEVVAALVALGVSASTSDSWDTLISKMSAIIKATGNATVADVLAGKTFSNTTGNGLQGTMPNRGAGGTVTPGTTNQTKAAGYYSSPITVLGDADLVPGNIRSGVDIFGVAGTLQPGGWVNVDYQKTAQVMPEGRTIIPIITLPLGIKRFSFSGIPIVVDARGNASTISLRLGYGTVYSGDINLLNTSSTVEEVPILFTLYVDLENRTYKVTAGKSTGTSGNYFSVYSYVWNLPSNFDVNQQISIRAVLDKLSPESYTTYYSVVVAGDVIYN
ncbi:hypothetical protein J41TS12_07200 [Paenibacillus antibioticophila]|uniref:Uncharacterized protein n=1 Tax=Paenibacillus antibioticophila TaxID=1274374 RepID=A0A920CG99_9BACL|nr:hypothetical protein [Paenibacillus antibioticophila]GIO35859.1 hypothetical protein J41TS12_07200 [Paenibacillus antibioticophila]